MQNFSSSLQAEINEKLDRVTNESDNPLKTAENAYLIAEAALIKLNQWLLDHVFETEQEEIAFFKTIKPDIHAQLIYYTELYHIEANLPLKEGKRLKKYLKRELERVDMFFERNKSIYNYYRRGNTKHDREYFLRSGVANNDTFSYPHDIDPRLSTPKSSRIAKIKAFEMVAEHLKSMMSQIKGTSVMSEDGTTSRSQVTFTGNKVEAVELCFGLHAVGAFNNGQATVKQIIAGFEKGYNTKLGNYYAVYHQNIRLRKIKERSSFIMKVAKANDDRMDYLDINPLST